MAYAGVLGLDCKPTPIRLNYNLANYINTFHEPSQKKYTNKYLSTVLANLNIFICRERVVAHRI